MGGQEPPRRLIMSGKTQLRLLISVALVFFAVILLYSLFFTQPVKLYSIVATEPGSAVSSQETETSMGQSVALPETNSTIDTGIPHQIDLNTASKADLMGIDGIGEVLAARIIEYREAQGPFASVDELGNVEGIGDAKLAALREMLFVS